MVVVADIDGSHQILILNFTRYSLEIDGGTTLVIPDYKTREIDISSDDPLRLLWALLSTSSTADLVKCQASQ